MIVALTGDKSGCHGQDVVCRDGRRSSSATEFSSLCKAYSV